MRLLAPAKINLHLRVGPPRADGFHPLLSWMCTAGLFDTLTLEQASDAPLPGNAPSSLIELQCDQPDLPTDERNLVVRVASAWGQKHHVAQGSRATRLRAVLNKQIPAGAGLGGGSSDGARALAGVNAIWNTGASAAQLSEFSARFGSDLSFFFFGSSSACKGRGEIVQPIGRPLPQWAVLFLPELAMPTPQVYRKFDEMKLGRTADVEQEPDWNDWIKLSAKELLARLVNDLEPPAFVIAPALSELRLSLERATGRIVRMSGSGSSLFTLFDEKEEAEDCRNVVGQKQNIDTVAVRLAPQFVDDLSNVPDANL